MKSVVRLLIGPVCCVLCLAWQSLSAQQWSVDHLFTDPDEVQGSLFGSAVGLYDDVIAVGAPGNANGKVYVFQRNAGGVDQWEFVQTVLPPVPEGSHFGQAMHLNEHGLFVGGSNGSWWYRWRSAEVRFDPVAQLDTVNADAFASDGPLLAVGSAGEFLHSFDGVVVIHDLDDVVEGHPRLLASVGDPQTSQYGRYSCYAQTLAFSAGRLAVGDPCSPLASVVGEAPSHVQVYDVAGGEIAIDPAGYFEKDVYDTGIRRYGASLALLGDTLFIGWTDPEWQGFSTVEVLTRTTEGQWIGLDTLVPPVNAPELPDRRIGFSLALYGTSVAVGGNGALLYFPSSASGWSYPQMVFAFEGPVNALTCDEGRLLAGAPGDVAGYGSVVLFTDPTLGLGPLEALGSRLLISPNPGVDAVTLTTDRALAGTVSITIHDAMGRCCGAWTHTGPSSFTIARNGLADGFYYIHLADGSGKFHADGRIVWK